MANIGNLIGTLVITRNDGKVIFNGTITDLQINSAMEFFDDPGAGAFSYTVVFTPPYSGGSMEFIPLDNAATLKVLLGSMMK